MSLPNYGAIALVHNYADRVSLAGNCSSLGRKFSFPTVGNCNMLYNKRLQTLSVAETSASQKLA